MRLYGYVFVHVIFEEIGAEVSAMSIKDGKVAAFGPPPLVVGFSDVHDDGDSILIEIFD